MSDMTEEDEDKATDALIMWLRSQDISPGDAIPILVKGIIAALVSCCHGAGRDKRATLNDVRAGAKIAADLLTETLDNLAVRVKR